MVPADLRRYLTYYAHRIRVIDFSLPGVGQTFTPSAWQALHLATNWKSGVLAPRLTEMCLHLFPESVELEGDAAHTMNAIKVVLVDEVMPYIALFRGQDTVSVDIELKSDQRIHGPSVQFLLGPLADNIKELSLRDIAPAESQKHHLAFIPNFLVAHRWQKLRVLKVQDVTAVSLQHISTLPLLATFEVSALSKLPDRYNMDDGTLAPFNLQGTVRNAFHSLQHLLLGARRLATITKFLQCALAPKHDGIQNIKCRMTGSPSTPADTAQFLTTIQNRCSISLRQLDIEDLVAGRENVDIPLSEETDLSLLYNFNLEHLNISPAHTSSGCLTAHDIERIIESWPNITHLQIDGSHFNSRIPRLDHSHVLSLLYGCPRLRMLGLRFDATKITGGEVGLNDVAPILEALSVGDSPIYSPSRVGLFLRNHCPGLRKGSLYYTDSTGGIRHPPNAPQYLYCERWSAVERRYLAS